MNSSPLINFSRLGLGRKALVILIYIALWVPFDYAAFLTTKIHMPSSWYPNAGIAIGFATYFGWPLVLLEMACRFLMGKMLWSNQLGPGHFFTYILLPGLLTWLISSRLRQIIIFERRIDTARMALIFVAFAFFGAIARSGAIQLSGVLLGIYGTENFLHNLSMWAAGDLIGIISLAPFLIAVLGPALAGQARYHFEQREIPFLATSLLSLALLFVLFTIYVPDNHYAYWHLTIGLHVLAAWSLGYRWTTFQIMLVNLLLSVVEATHPSHIPPLEQQSFLAVTAGVGLYLAGLFAEKARHRETMEQLSADLLHTAEEKIQFRNTLSHELRTPLALILGYSEMMKKNPSLFPAPLALEKIKASTKALRQILSRLAILTNPQGGWEKSRMERLDLREVVSEVADKWSQKAREKGITLSWEAAASPPLTATVITEGVRMVIDEVVGNAVKFTQKGGVKITASTAARGSIVRIAVEDTGDGIDPSFPLFHTFKQQVGGHNRPQGGLGIGLSICRVVLETMGGKITLRWSEQGQGSHFVLEFYDRE